MSILVAFASKHGATGEIAERIAEKLRAMGQEAEARNVADVGDLRAYDAFVIGSAVYYMRWQKEAVEFVRRNQVFLARKPVWLFSSGPLGTETTDARGRDVRQTTEPREITEFCATVNPRGQRVFFGAMDRTKLGFGDRLITRLPAAHTAIPDGDFRAWTEIDAWAESIAYALGRVPVPAAV